MENIDWKSGSPAAYQQRREYFLKLRDMIEKLQFSSVPHDILKDWNVFFSDYDNDDFPRGNIDRPEKG